MAMVNLHKPKAESGKEKDGVLAHDNSESMHAPTLHLGHEHLKALGLHKGPMPKVGSKIHVHGLVHVGSTSEDVQSPPSGGKAEKGGEGHTRRSMTLHFHKMDIGDGNNSGQPAQDQEAERAKGARAEMDKALAREEGGSKRGKRKTDEEGTDQPTPRGGGD